MGCAMSNTLKWTLRSIGFLAMTFILMLSGIFDSMAESMREPVASFINHFNFGDPSLFADNYSDSLDSMWLNLYVILNAVVSLFAVIVFEWLVKIARQS